MIGKKERSDPIFQYNGGLTSNESERLYWKNIKSRPILVDYYTS
ncbi:hypothetical protein IFVP69_C190006 [Vibrio parahaemolyticus]